MEDVLQLDSALAVGNAFAATLVFVAFILYNRNDDKINTGTWFILAVGDALDFGSYFEMTGHDFLKNVVPFCFAVGSILTFFYALVRKRFSFPDAADIFVILIDLIITAVWLGYGWLDSTEANLAYQATTVLAFIPMYRGLANGNERETVVPWALWTGGYMLFFFSFLLWQGTWEESIYPLVGVLTHALVLCFALQYRIDQRKKRT